MRKGFFPRRFKTIFRRLSKGIQVSLNSPIIFIEISFLYGQFLIAADYKLHLIFFSIALKYIAEAKLIYIPLTITWILSSVK